MDDYTANIFTSGVLGFGPAQTASGVIETRSDKDWFKVSLQAGTSYEFELTGALTLSVAEMLSLYDKNGIIKASAFDRSIINGPLIKYTPATSDNYFIQVGDLFNATGGYQVSAKITSNATVTTQQFLLNKFNISMADAGAWVIDRLNKPLEIYTICADNGITSKMLADIVQPLLPTIVVTGVVVNEWMQANGQPTLI